MNGYRELLERARDRLNDMLRGDDGQAWKEAQRFVDGLDAAMGECEKRAEPDLLNLKLPIAIRVGGGIFGKGVSLRTVANKLKLITDTYDNDLKARMSKQSINRENETEDPAVAQLPAEVVRDLVGALDQAKIWFEWVTGNDPLPKVEPIEQVLQMTCAALAKVKDHGL